MENDDNDYRPYTLVSFSISSENLDPQIVDQALGMVAEDKHKKGDLPKNNRKFPPYKLGLWSMDSQVAPELPFAKHLEVLLDILEPKREQILNLAKEYNVRFFCSLYAQGGLDLPAQLIGRIAGIGADLSVTVYPPDDGGVPTDE